MKRLFFVVLFLLVMPISLGALTDNVHSITLLSVSRAENDTLRGGTAELQLQLRPGNGAIFIESYPLSRLDTQITTRLANEIACKFTTEDCTQYDFFYTIRADAPLVSGPSAGGATALLTLAVLEEVMLQEDIAMTGAISSGGIITSVGGVKEKLTAASLAGKRLAIVPLLSFSDNASNNDTLELADVENLSLVVEPVLTLQEALRIAATKDISFKQQTFTVDKAYVARMKQTATLLCNRSSQLEQSLYNVTINDSGYVLAKDFLNKSTQAKAEENYYAQASFCYSANINLRELLIENLSSKLKLENKERLASSLKTLSTSVDAYPLVTFSDLETYFIVKERILEAEDYLDELNDSEISSRMLALAIERYYSAVAWSEFFDLSNEPLVLDQTALRLAAIQEFERVESRLNYLRLYLPDYFLEGTQEQLILAKKYFAEEQYALALFKATKTRASANAYLSTITLTEENSKPLVEAKLERTSQVIATQEYFSILGYSYYEYASELVKTDTGTALLYSEYALAFSDLHEYFVPRRNVSFFISLQRAHVYMFIAGLATGLLILLLRESFIKRKTRK